MAISEDLLTKTVASSAEALHLRRTIDRLVMLRRSADRDAPSRPSCKSCEHAGAGTAHTRPRQHDHDPRRMCCCSACICGVRSISDETVGEAARRGDGPRLIGNFLQMVELHYRDGWPIARYAAALGVTDDRLHAHCKREKGRSPRAIIHERLIHEACTRLQQLDLPVEQIGYGLGFRDPGLFQPVLPQVSGHFARHLSASRPARPGQAQPVLCGMAVAAKPGRMRSRASAR